MNSATPTIQDIEQLHRKYAPNELVYDLVHGHCQIVTEIALWCADNIAGSTAVDRPLLQAAGLLHDIGSYVFFGERGEDLGNGRLYPLHSILGARILADEGVNNRIAELVADHLLLGLTKREILDRPWLMPARDYEPQSIEGKLLCYADRFHSKRPVFNSYGPFLEGLRGLPLQAEKFERYAKEFGIPDIPALAAKYEQPIRQNQPN